MKTILNTVATIALMASTGANAQVSWNHATTPGQTQNGIAELQDQQLRQMAARLANNPITTDVSPAYSGHLNLDVRRDPWHAVTNAELQSNHDAVTYRVNYSTRVQVDFNNDTKVDVAQMVNNSRQGAVLVTFAGRPGPVVVFKSDKRFVGGEQIVTAGRNRILLNRPGQSMILIFMQGGQPRSFRMGD